MPESISNDESLRRLREFLRQLEELLAELTEHPAVLIPGRHHDPMKAAWVSVRPKFPMLVKQLETTAASNVIPALKTAGLLGDELIFKLSIFDHARDELRDSLASRTEAPREGLLKRGWRALGKLWKRALEAGDVILGSLASVLPPAEAIKEYKEAAESGLELGLGIAEATDPADPRTRRIDLDE